MSRSPLQIDAVTGRGDVQFSTGGPMVWVNVADLDGARLTIRRFGVAYLKRNAVDEADTLRHAETNRGWAPLGGMTLHEDNLRLLLSELGQAVSP